MRIMKLISLSWKHAERFKAVHPNSSFVRSFFNFVRMNLWVDEYGFFKIR